nr:urease subunit gamma [Halochromatium glycolicum]
MMADVSQKRRDKGIKLNQPEAVARVSSVALDTGVMDRFDVFGNLVLLTAPAVAERVDARLGAAVDQVSGLAFGACRLPNEAGLIIKVLAHETAQVKAKLHECRAIVREEAIGAKLSPPTATCLPHSLSCCNLRSMGYAMPYVVDTRHRCRCRRHHECSRGIYEQEQLPPESAREHPRGRTSRCGT